MKTIEEALKDGDPTPDLSISNEERIALIEILGMVGGALQSGKLWFNSPKADQKPFINICMTMAKKFSNMEVQNVQ